MSEMKRGQFAYFCRSGLDPNTNPVVPQAGRDGFTGLVGFVYLEVRCKNSSIVHLVLDDSSVPSTTSCRLVSAFNV